MRSTQLYGGIEAGGTKFVCVVASGPEQIVQEVRFPTTSPEETIAKSVEFFRPFVTSKQVNAIGVGTFGPLDVNPGSPTYGFITSTPKPGWMNADLVGMLKRGMDVQIAIDTDVNAAGLGESIWGAGRGFDPSLYLTIGTGIGGGYVKDGKPLLGLLTPEMGHLRIPHDRGRDPFDGSCPFHGDCFEGLASGPAIQKRLGIPGADVPESDGFWDIEAEYIALGLMNYILVLSPKKIILGGGVMQRGFLFSKVREKVLEFLNGYLSHDSLLERIDEYIVPPGLGNQAGSMGAIALAMHLTGRHEGAP